MLDFPASPTLNQQFSAASSTWKWDGTAWNLIPQMTPATASDTPPANPAIGQMWWRASNGQLYIWYDDGNTAQWVQTSTAVAPVPGAWEVIADVAMTGQSNADMINGAFKKLRISGALTLGAAGGMGVRLSKDGTTWPQGATDYSYQLISASGTTVQGVSAQGGSMLFSGSSTDTAPFEFSMIIDDFNTGVRQCSCLGQSRGRSGGPLQLWEFGNVCNITGPFVGIRIVQLQGSTLNGNILFEGVRG